MIQFDNAVERFGKIILKEMKDAGVNCWIAGGAIRDYFMGVSVKTDYDMFFPNEMEYEKARVYFNAKKAEIKWESGNGMKVVYENKTIDLVKKFFDTPQSTIEAFDFTVTMFAIDSERVYHGETSFIDLSKRQLMINKITYPASTLSRSFRYYKKGFLMCKGEMKKLIESIQEMPKEEKILNNETEERQPSGDSLSRFFIGID
jgi:hypothetical protein